MSTPSLWRSLACVPRWNSLGILITARGRSQKWGGLTQDPYQHLRRKLAKQHELRYKKFPLISDARKERRRDLPVNVTSLGAVIPVQVPLEKYAKAPFYMREAWGQKWLAFKEGLRTVYSGAVIKRKLKKIEPFKPVRFACWAQKQFVKANDAIQRKDRHALRQLTTENASLVVEKDFALKRYYWKYLDEVERPRVVCARTAPVGTSSDLFGQVVVRIHTKQKEAVLDSAGNLVWGHMIRPVNAVQYVVFERHLANKNAKWRICAKLPPQLPYQSERQKTVAQPPASHAQVQPATQ